MALALWGVIGGGHGHLHTDEEERAREESVRNAKAIFNKIPTGYPKPGKTTVYDTSSTIDIETLPLNGVVFVKVLYLSANPYMRGKMRDASIVSYSVRTVPRSTSLREKCH
ncbi:hypothetical protein K435DRAFT_878137 [Dendrothele bispora CBS 962.96]|uniref:Oxidoreductase N-terminal domain-containing protein n=1 Tax=Dendrothele bispora (strain CBS 962.96) TaxID=1314807 RepID=A0A4S8KNW0_DENBC|nr:hypothetical protein K435DRAFT_878137 [Dendrothele bispora CBS 962.96]